MRTRDGFTGLEPAPPIDARAPDEVETATFGLG